jgi:signal transduction histidine kinase
MLNRPRLWLRSKTGVHLPRRTVRIRLTLLYGGLFLVSGAALLAITYVLFERATRVNGAQVRIDSGPLPDHVIPTLPTKSLGTKALGEEIKRAADLHQLLVNSGIALAILAVVALLLGWFVAGRMLRPLRTITATARRISARDLHERIAMSGPNDELKELGDTFDELLARLQRSWDAQRQFVSNVSHELRSPLTRLRLQAEIASTDPAATVESLQDGYKRVIAAAHRQEELIAALLSLAKGQRGLQHQETFDLAPIAQAILDAHRPQADELGLQIDSDIKPASVGGDPRLIEQMIGNLVDNAILHNTRGGSLQLTTATEAGQGVLMISNDGPIIPTNELERLFRPFERLEPGRRQHQAGHGLGLSIVDAIATAHGAATTARSKPQGGLEIEITFPAPAQQHSGTAREADANRSPRPVGQDQPRVLTEPVRTQVSAREC